MFPRVSVIKAVPTIRISDKTVLPTHYLFSACYTTRQFNHFSPLIISYLFKKKIIKPIMHFYLFLCDILSLIFKYIGAGIAESL